MINLKDNRDAFHEKVKVEIVGERQALVLAEVKPVLY